MRILISTLLLILINLPLFAQKTSRSGFPAPEEDLNRFRRFPCGGNVILEEDFTNGLPAGWQVLDVDMLEPNGEITFLTPNPGWQGVADFKDNLRVNKIFASPSYYEDTVGTSNDYLILPQLTLPNNTCLSWYAYSQDVEFGESYEIRVSTTTPDEAGFLANPAVYTVADQGSDFTFETASLADYGGQTVYIAFRHTSTDKFILAIDDVRLAEVENFDMAMFQVDELDVNPGDSVFITGSIINRGLSPVVFDSSQLRITCTISGDEIFSFGVADSFELMPNDTINWVADSAWKPSTEASVPLKVWISGFGTDDDVTNDTISRFQPIGNTVSVDPNIAYNKLELRPNPVQSSLFINVASIESRTLDISIIDLQGKLVLEEKGRNILGQNLLEIASGLLSPGLYVLQLKDESGKTYLEKFLKE